MEVNTALMLYKSMVKSVIDYGSFVFYPSNKNLQLKLERRQFLDIRTALGYRNSAPNGIIMAESKLMYIGDRSLMLAKAFCSKVYKYGKQIIRDNLNKLREVERFTRYRNPRAHQSVICLARDSVIRRCNIMGPSRDSFELCNMTFQQVTDRILYNAEIDNNIKTTVPKKNNCNIDNIKEYNELDIKLLNVT